MFSLQVQNQGPAQRTREFDHAFTRQSFGLPAGVRLYPAPKRRRRRDALQTRPSVHRAFDAGRHADRLGAVTPAGPPSWKDLADKIWHPWSTSLLLVECRGKAKPVRSVEAFPVATTLLGLPLFFRGDLPMDNPLTAELAEMTRQVSDARAMIPRILPAKPAADGKAFQPLAVGVPLAPVKGPFWRREVQQVLLSVAPPVSRGRAAGVKVPV